MLDHEVTALHWTNAKTFAQDLKCNLERIKTTCCFLTVCVMAHGSPGAVRGDDGSFLEVNQILQLVNDCLPYRTPAVPVVSQNQFWNCMFAALLRISLGIGMQNAFCWDHCALRIHIYMHLPLSRFYIQAGSRFCCSHRHIIVIICLWL